MKKALNQVTDSISSQIEDDELLKLIGLYNTFKLSLLKAERNWLLRLFDKDLYDLRIKSYSITLECFRNKLKSKGYFKVG